MFAKGILRENAQAQLAPSGRHCRDLGDQVWFIHMAIIIQSQVLQHSWLTWQNLNYK